MHDRRLEDQLRTALRAEGDGQPLTITTAELERRSILRRRARNSQRLSLVAAAVAVVAIGSVVAVGNGWLRMPAVGVDPSPSPAEAPSSIRPTAEPTQVVPTSPGPGSSAPIGGPADAIVVRSIIDPASSVHRIEVQLWPATGDMFVLVTFSGILGGNPTPDAPARVSQDGLLAVPLVDWEGSGRHIAVAIYDLLQPTRDPHIVVDLGSNGIAWGPDGRLALFDPQTITIVEPYAAVPGSLPIPPGVVVATPDRQDEIWAGDGRGFLAWKQVGLSGQPGVRRLDGTFAPDASPTIFAPLGIEQVYDRDGRQLLVGCKTLGDDGRGNDCSLLAEVPGGATEVVYRESSGEARIADHRWEANGRGIWLLIDQRAADDRTLDLVVRAGGPGSFVDVATLSDIEVRVGTDPRLAGIAADGGRLAIALDAGLVGLVDTASGRSVAAAGTFAGWANQTGAVYPSPGG